MNTPELMHLARSDSISNFVKASTVKTKADITRLKEKGYDIGFTYDELKEQFPTRVAESLYYNNGFDKTFYFDKDKYVLFKVPLYGKRTLTSLDECITSVINTAIQLENEIKSCEYTQNLMLLNDRMRMEMLNMLIEDNKLKDPYAAFLNFYQTSDYGCSQLTIPTIKKILSSKTDEQKQSTANNIKDFPDRVTVYRGEGDKSAKLNETVSWTTDINIANFFAARLYGNEARIHIAEVDRSDIIEHFTYEHECIILPEDIELKDTITLYGTQYFNEVMPLLSPKYLAYRDYITDYLDFKIDDKEHGRLHTARVLLNSLFIANEMEIDRNDVNKICLACVLHDVGRDNNGDDALHGEKSAEIYKELSKTDDVMFPYDETVAKLIKYHCLPDEVGKTEMTDDEQKLLDIVKDADALDRVRFGIRDLDINQLRTEPAKSMTMLANLAVDGLRLPEQEQEQGLNMT